MNMGLQNYCCKMAMLSKTIFNDILIKIPVMVFIHNYKNNPKILMEKQETPNRQRNPKQ